MDREPESLKKILLRNPVIPAVKDDVALKRFLNSSNEVVFILYGDIITLNDKVNAVIKAGKHPFVHLDMINGLASNPVIIEYIHKNFKRECGIITTKSNIAKKALDSGIRVVQRYFMLDSLSVESAIDGIGKVRTDAIEIMPGIIPRVIGQVSHKTNVPIIAGGLVQTQQDVEKLLASGALSCSTSKHDLWKLNADLVKKPSIKTE